MQRTITRKIQDLKATTHGAYRSVCDAFATRSADERTNSLSDAIVDLEKALADAREIEALHCATRRGEPLIHCARCGALVPQISAVMSDGEGPEQGKTFFYCSEHCEERH